MDEFLETIYRYYPKNRFAGDVTYSYTPEMTEKFKTLESLINSESNFPKVCDDLSVLTNGVILDYSFTAHDLSWHTYFYLPYDDDYDSSTQCGLYISAVCEYYCVYFTDSEHRLIPYLKRNSPNENQRKLAGSISKIIERYFPNHQPFPREWLHKEVPDVYTITKTRDYDERATFFECLITSAF